MLSDLRGISEDKRVKLILLACSQANDKNGLSVTIRTGCARASVDLNTFEQAEPSMFAHFYPGVNRASLRKTATKIQFYIEFGELNPQSCQLNIDWHKDGLDGTTPNAASNKLPDGNLVEEVRWTITLEPIKDGSTAFGLVSNAIDALCVDGARLVEEASTKRKTMSAAAEVTGKAKKRRSDAGEWSKNLYPFVFSFSFFLCCVVIFSWCSCPHFVCMLILLFDDILLL